MNPSSSDIASELHRVSRKLQELHARILHVEQRQNFAPGGFPLLDRLLHDPAWAWLRSLSTLIADIDQAIMDNVPLADSDRSALGAHVRGLLFGEGDLVNDAFLFRYRQLMQTDAQIAAIHGELRGVLKSFPAEPVNDAERTSARERWSQRVKHHGSHSLLH